MGEPVLEAFYLIAPRLSFKDGKIASREAEVAYCYPPDARDRFADIPFFCFPDLEQIKLESMALSRQEHFAFTLTDDHGTRFYGVCMRYLDQGHGMRFDVGLRPRICLCVITRHNQPSLFRLLLLLLHSLLLFHRNDVAALEPVLQNISAQAFPRLGGVLRLDSGIERPVHISVPLHAKHSEVMSLPLLQRLGSVGLLTLMSVCLTERRIVFTADDMTTLSSAVHACVSLLYPFEWHHIYIPVLPAKLLGYVTAPMPFIIGVKRYMMQQVLAQPTSDVVIVDVDKGEITTTGETALTTFLGRSGTMLRQATEGFERVKHKALKILHTLQQSDADEQQLAQNSNRDAVAYVLTELKAINLKHTQIKWPGKSLVTGKQGDEWQTAAERRLRETLLLFFLYHFHDVDRIVRRAGMSTTQRSQLDSFRAAFLHSRSAAGDGPAVLGFLQEFVHSQMFEQFCGNAAEPQNAPGSDDAELADTFYLCRKKLRSTQQAPTIPNIQRVIRSVLHDENTNGEAASRSAHGSTYYDKMALALTSNSDAQFDTQRAVEQVIARAFNSEHFTKIMRTLRYRLQDCKGGNWRHGNKALALLAVLLVSGPEYVLSETLQIFHQVRALKAYRSAIPGSYVRMIRSRASRCVQLLLDHRALLLQRRWALARQKGFVASRHVQVPKVALAPGGVIPRLGALHEQLRPPSMSIAPASATGRVYDDSQRTPMMSVPSSESDDSLVYLQSATATEEDPFVRVSAIELLLGGNDGDDGFAERVAQPCVEDSNLLDLDELLQRSPAPYDARSPLRAEALFPPSEPTTPTSAHAAADGRGASEWRSSFEESFMSRSGSIAESYHSAAEPDHDVLELLSSTNSARREHARSASEQELLRPPTPELFDQFELGSAQRPETNPFAVSAFAHDPFAKPAAKNSSNNVDLLSSDPFDPTPLQPARPPTQTAPSVSDLLDLMNQSHHSPVMAATLDVFGSSTQPLTLTPVKPTAAAATTAHAFMSPTPPLGHMGMVPSPFPQQTLMRPTMQPIMQPAQTVLPPYSPYVSGNGQFPVAVNGQAVPLGSPHGVPGAHPQYPHQPVMTPVRPPTHDPFAGLGLPRLK